MEDRLQRLEEEVRGLREEVKAGNALVLAILQKSTRRSPNCVSV